MHVVCMIVKQFQVSVDKVSCAHQIMLRRPLLIGTSFWCFNINGLPVSVSNSVPEIHWDWFFETFPLSTEQLNTVNYFLHWAVKYLNYVSRVLMDITSILIYCYFLWLVCCRRIPVHPNNRLKITLMEISVAAQVEYFCVWNSFTY